MISFFPLTMSSNRKFSFETQTWLTAVWQPTVHVQFEFEEEKKIWKNFCFFFSPLTRTHSNVFINLRRLFNVQQMAANKKENLDLFCMSCFQIKDFCFLIWKKTESKIYHDVLLSLQYKAVWKTFFKIDIVA